MSGERTAAAPVALFAFRRPVHFAKTLEALSRNTRAGETPLYIFIDRPKTPDLDELQRRVVEVARSASGFHSVSVCVRDAPMGLAGNITSGVTDVVRKHGRVIVVEDDLVTSPHFLEFMNDGLNAYQHDARVASIHGWIYPTLLPLPTTFFLRGADCWGWATWQDRWQLFEPDGRKLLQELEQRRLTSAFDVHGAYPFTLMLRQQIAGSNDSWAIRWRASCFLRELVTLFPGRPLVFNIGNDGDGATHSSATTDFDGVLAAAQIPVRTQSTAPSRIAIISIWMHLMRLRLRARLGWQ